MVRGWLVVVAVGCGLAACGSRQAVNQFPAAGGETTGGAASGPRWGRFPVDAPVRPIVLAGGPVVEPRDGYLTDSAKIAASTLNFTLPADGPVAPATVDGFPVTSAADTMRAAHLQFVADGANVEQPVPVTDLKLDHASFTTDRGPRELPAWLMTIPDSTGPVAVVAVAASSIFGPVPVSFEHATVDTAGLVITREFVGGAAGSGPCTADYRLDVVEHATFVEAAVVMTRDGGGSCKAEGHPRSVTASLRQPLGARVLVDSKSSAPLIVTNAP